jgi:hypothetical protein
MMPMDFGVFRGKQASGVVGGGKKEGIRGKKKGNHCCLLGGLGCHLEFLNGLGILSLSGLDRNGDFSWAGLLDILRLTF